MSEKNKPFYKKWWGIAIIAFVVIAGVYGIIEEEVAEDDDSNEEVANVENEEYNNNENDNDNNGSNEEQQQDGTIEVNKEIELGNVSMEIQTVKVEDGKMELPVWWSHWAGNNKVHLTALVYPVVKQNDEELKEVGEHDSIFKQVDKGIDSLAKFKYELIDDSPVEITLKTTADDSEEETIKVDTGG